MKRMNHLLSFITYDINLGFNSILTDGKQFVGIKKVITGSTKDNLLQDCFVVTGEVCTTVTLWAQEQAGTSFST